MIYIQSNHDNLKKIKFKTIFINLLNSNIILYWFNLILIETVKQKISKNNLFKEAARYSVFSDKHISSFELRI